MITYFLNFDSVQNAQDTYAQQILFTPRSDKHVTFSSAFLNYQQTSDENI